MLRCAELPKETAAAAAGATGQLSIFGMRKHSLARPLVRTCCLQPMVVRALVPDAYVRLSRWSLARLNLVRPFNRPASMTHSLTQYTAKAESSHNWSCFGDVATAADSAVLAGLLLLLLPYKVHGDGSGGRNSDSVKIATIDIARLFF